MNLFKAAGIIGFLVLLLILMNILLSNRGGKKITLDQMELDHLSGQRPALKKDRPLVVNFWASWCAPCVAEMPIFEKMRINYTGKIDIIMVSNESQEKIRNHQRKYNYGLTFLRSRKTMVEYGLEILPSTYFYNSKGQLVRQISGPVSEEELRQEMESLLKI